MKRIVAGAGVALLFVACTDANPTRPEPANLQPSFAKNASTAAFQSYLITTYY